MLLHKETHHDSETECALNMEVSAVHVHKHKMLVYHNGLSASSAA